MDGMHGLGDMDEIVEEFLVESHENLDQLDRDLVDLEKDPESHELLSSIFRTVHTIKGTSGFLAFGTLESVTHVGESLLARLRDGAMTLTPEITTVLLELVDAVRAILAEIERTGAEGLERHESLIDRMNLVLTDSAEPTLVGAAVAPAAATVNGHNANGAAAFPHASLAGGPSSIPSNGSQLLPLERPEADLDEPAPEDSARRSVADSSIRVDVGLLDSLMNLVGELVLTRNQMLQRAAGREDIELQRATHRLNLIAGELQEGVMRTRMQPIDNVWSKLPRVVRDLSVSLGKKVDLRMEGKDTDLDKTILEAVRDPLTHLVRNAVDHGIEHPDMRLAAGKSEHGTLLLRAFHEGGQVNIEISDDGAGIDPAKLREKAANRGMLDPAAAGALSDREAVNLIFAPGFSTAAAVTNVSGRGVGMDVVKTNIEKIGGTIELSSTPGQGTVVRIRIPLTLAIIPALVVAADGNRYAIPQVNLLELVRVDPGKAAASVETVHGAPVYRLRGRLLPLVSLREQLGASAAEQETIYIAVLHADGREFGLVVDDIRDTEEIVVKPLGRPLREIELYAGATIMGDGQVALILDANALVRRAGMTLDGAEPAANTEPGTDQNQRTSLLVVALGDGRRAAVSLSTVDRLEEFAPDQVELIGGTEVVQYRDQILPLLRLDQALQGFAEQTGGERLQVVVCQSGGRLVGVVVAGVLDIVDQELTVRSHLATGGHDGSAVVAGHVTELVNIDHAVDSFQPRLLVPSAS